MTESYGRGASGAGMWLGWSIFSTLCCCTPLGIVGIVYAALGMGARDRGDWAACEDYVAKARGWTIAAIVLGVIAGVVGGAAQLGADTGG